MSYSQLLCSLGGLLWNGDAPTIALASTKGPIPPKTDEQKLARKNDLKAKSTLLLAIPDEHLLKFHGIKVIMNGDAPYGKLSRSDAGENTSSTNKAVNIAHEVSTANSQGQASSSSYADDVMFFFFVSQSNNQQLDNEDLEQIDTDDLEEIDLKWQGTRESGGLDIEMFQEEFVPVETNANRLSCSRGIVHQVLDSEVIQLGLESLEARIVVHQKNEAVYEEDIAFLKYDVKVRDNSIKELKNYQISVNNKTGIGFDSQMTKNELHDIHKDNSKVFESASDSSVNEIEEENNKVNDMFKKVEGYPAVPPPYTRNYMPSRPDLSFARLDDSVYKTNVSESTTSKSSKDNLEQPKDVRPSAPIVEEWESM
ncbi:hypothetical protein Tco_0190876 [Tanacetum coccineum]